MSVARIPFGLHVSTQRMKAVSEVDRGLACDCVCPDCHGQLLARKGEVNVEHFSHYDTAACGSGLETSIHLMAKQILEEQKAIVVPDQTFTPKFREEGRWIYGEEITVKGYEFKAGRVSVEKSDGNIRPDIILHKGSKQLRVEVAVTSFVDKTKKAKAISRELYMVQVNLRNFYRSKVYDIKSFTTAVLGLQSNKEWVSNPSLRRKYKTAVEELKKRHKKELKDMYAGHHPPSLIERTGDLNASEIITDASHVELLYEAAAKMTLKQQEDFLRNPSSDLAQMKKAILKYRADS